MQKHFAGSEFWNKLTLGVLNKYKIKYFTVYSDKKGAIVGEWRPWVVYPFGSEQSTQNVLVVYLIT